MGSYKAGSLHDVEDTAPGAGVDSIQEMRFATEAFDATHVGFSHYRFKPGMRQPFGHVHHHEGAEEVYVVIAGSGTIKLDDDVVQLQRLDTVRVDPTVIRAFEGGPEGMEILAFGPRHDGDGEVLQDWWVD